MRVDQPASSKQTRARHGIYCTKSQAPYSVLGWYVLFAVCSTVVQIGELTLSLDSLPSLLTLDPFTHTLPLPGHGGLQRSTVSLQSFVLTRLGPYASPSASSSSRGRKRAAQEWSQTRWVGASQALRPR